MEDELDRALQVDVLAASLRMGEREAKDLLEYLSGMLEQALPANTTVKRGGWIFSSVKPVEELTVRFPEFHYTITRHRHGGFSALQMKLVRGVVLKSSEIPMEQCINEIVQELSKLSENNAQARKALNKFVTGS